MAQGTDDFGSNLVHHQNPGIFKGFVITAFISNVGGVNPGKHMHYVSALVNAI